MRGEANRWLTYRELAPKLADYVHEMGFTHVEFMPVAEHPFDGSWGYQVTGYLRAHEPVRLAAQDFMALVDLLHQKRDRRDPRLGPRPLPDRRPRAGLFRRGRTSTSTPTLARDSIPTGTRSSSTSAGPRSPTSLIANALFWLDKYHIDGLRVDAVASMLYRDYSRKAGEWVANIHWRPRKSRGDRPPQAGQRAGPRSSSPEP